MVKQKHTTNEDDANFIPLPIQTFLWRQTNPFLGAKLGKMHEASCVNFERVICQNILHGLSPSLSDAINSIPRWRFIQAAFPHVIHCCATLLNQRKLTGDANSKLTQAQVKILYILHWMLQDAASECMDNEHQTTPTIATPSLPTQYLFPLNCVQLFVFLLVPLVHTLSESDFEGNFRLEASIPMWQALWDYRQPDIFCFCSPVKARKSQVMLMPLIRKSISTAAAQDIYVGGGAGDTGGIYLGDAAPTSPARVLPSATVSTLPKRVVAPVIPLVSRQSGPPPKSVSTHSLKTGEQPPKLSAKEPSKKKDKSRAKRLVRSVSDYKRTHPLSLEDLAKQLQYVEEGSLADEEMGDRAPLVQLKDICGPTWPSFDLPSTSTACEVVCELCGQVLMRSGSLVGVCKCEKSSQNYKVVPINAPGHASARTSVVESSEQESSFSEMLGTREPASSKRSSPTKESTASSSPSTVSSPSRHPPALTSTTKVALTDDGQGSLRVVSHPAARERATPTPLSEGDADRSGNISPTTSSVPLCVDAQQATYFDIAVLRCLFNDHWVEDGVHWGLEYYYQRVVDISSQVARQQACFRQRSRSVPHVRVTPAQPTPAPSKTDLDVLGLETKRPPAWKFLQPEDDLSPTGSVHTSKGKVVFHTNGGSATGTPTHGKLSSGKVEPAAGGQRCVLRIEDEHTAVTPTSTLLSAAAVSPKRPSMLAPPGSVDPHTLSPHSLSPERRRSSLANFRQIFTKPIESKNAFDDTRSEVVFRERSITQAFLGSSVTCPLLPHISLAALSASGRCATDSNIQYTGEMLPEVVGSSAFIDKNGNLNLAVFPKALAVITQRRLSLRVTECVLNIMDLLLDMDLCNTVLKATMATDDKSPTPKTTPKPQAKHLDNHREHSQRRKAQEKARGKGHHAGGGHAAVSAHSSGSPAAKSPTEEMDAFQLLMMVIVRVYQHLGCAQGCNEGNRSPPADFLRSQARNLLSRLQRISAGGFTQFWASFVERHDISVLVDFMHAFTGFCVDPGSAHRGRSVSRLSQESQSRMKQSEFKETPSYHNNFLASQKGVEGLLVTAAFKPLVTKLMGKLPDLQLPENMSLYHDVRTLLSYIQENHGSPFRRVALSGLSDGVDKSAKASPKPNFEMRDSLGRHLSIMSATSTFSGHSAVSKQSSIVLPAITISSTGLDTRSTNADSDSDHSTAASPSNLNVARPGSLRRNLLKKGGKDDSGDDDSSTPGTPRQRLSSGETDISSASPLLPDKGKRKGSKLQLALNLLKSVKMDAQQGGEEAADVSESEADQPPAEDAASSSRARRMSSKNKLSFKSTARSLSMLSLLGKDRKRRSKEHQAEDAAELARIKEQRTLAEHLRIPDRVIVNIAAVRAGAERFAFMLEACQPGSVPDAPLLAALLDLKAPVVARATIFLECCFFVNRCNRNQWPDWIRSNAPTLAGRAPSALGNRGTPSGMRRANILQRAAGKMFYRWAEAIGSRLEELIQKDRVHAEQIVAQPFDELTRRQMRVDDDLEDFLDEGAVNPGGESCPFALKMVACMLLLEITAFLRETFQFLPRARAAPSKPKSSGWEKLMSHRRWSVLSATFNPSQHSGSIQSIAQIAEMLPAPEERRVSFSRDEHAEDLHSSHSTIDESGERRELCQQFSNQSWHGRSGNSKYNGDRSPTVALPLPGLLTVQSDSHGTVAASAQRLTQARQRMLRQTGSVKRKSIKLKKKGRTRTEDFTGDDQAHPSVFASIRRKSVMLARKLTFSKSISKDSLIAEQDDDRKRSLASDELLPESPEHTSGTAGAVSSGEAMRSPSPEQPPPPPQAVSPVPQASAAPAPEVEESAFYRQMPWLKAVVQLANMANFVCSHHRYCQTFCFERQLRQCFRLEIALRKVYGEDFPMEGVLDKRKALIESLQERVKERVGSVNERRRTSALVRPDSTLGRPLDRPGSALHLKKLLGEPIELDEPKEKEKAPKTSGGKKVLHEPDTPTIRKRVASTPMVKYMKAHLQLLCHAPMSTILKAAVVIQEPYFQDMLPVAWELLLEVDPNLVATAAALFIVSSVKQPDAAMDILKKELRHVDPSRRIAAVLRFYSLWRHRFHCWSKMEDGAHMVFKVSPPSIDFTLPSPPIGLSQQPCIDPPWMPHLKSKVQELTLNEEDNTGQAVMTMTKTRRKQKQEMMQRALQLADERKGEERRRYRLLSVPAQQQGAYEPALFQSVAVEEHEDEDGAPAAKQPVMPVSQPLFPSCLCSVAPILIEMLDDVQVNSDGVAVTAVVRRVIWTCLVEDTPLFIRHFLEKLTARDRQEKLMSLLRRLMFHFRELPAQSAHALFNYLVGFVMYYVRQPCEGSQEAIGAALSLIWLIGPCVYGLTFKDMKQTLRKEQCDAAIMITANVPSAKKIVVHGPDLSSIPSQFIINEDTQFLQLLTDSLDFFNIPEDQAGSHFLVDSKSGMIHSPNAYVRDFYFFRRSFYPQLNLVHMNPVEATSRLQHMGFVLKFVELGKVLLSHSVLKLAPEHIVPQRIFFLHEDLSKLPAFPRKALEACFGMYSGTKGNVLHGVDTLHKYVWTQLMAEMFSGMENPYLYGDLHLFINVVNGVLILHSEDSSTLRLCMATYINMAQNFKSLFASNGFFLIMPTILRCYSQHQTNLILCEVIEYTSKQFYIMHRKPFILQTFGAIAGLLDCVDDEEDFDPTLVKASHLFQWLVALEHVVDAKDVLEIMQLVEGDKPLKALDMCYKDDPNTFCILTDAFASCVTICAYAPDSRRSYQMLVVMAAVLPYFLRSLQDECKKSGFSVSALKHELQVLTTLIVEMKALINCCDSLARNFSGPQRNFDIVSVSGRGRSIACDSPQPFEDKDDTVVISSNCRTVTQATPKMSNTWEQIDDMELQRELFRKPRDALLCVGAEFLTKCTTRMKELSKALQDAKVPELLDYKAHMRLAEIAHALLKMAPYDSNTMVCAGLQRYFLDILPCTDWSQEQVRSALNLILRRLDKTFQKIGKRGGIRRHTNWDAVANWLQGLYVTISSYPYMAHLHFLKSSVQICLKIVVGDPAVLGGGDEGTVAHAPQTILSNAAVSQRFCTAVIKLVSILMQTLGQEAFGLEQVCSTETLGTLADRIEAVLCHVILPLVLRAETARKDIPQLRQADLHFAITHMLSAINPQRKYASATSNLLQPPPTTGTINRGTSAQPAPQPATETRSGSVSASDKQPHGTVVLSPRSLRDSIYQCVFFGLQVVIVGFEKKLAGEWHRIAKCVKELGHKRLGGIWIWGFLDFVLSTDTPLRMLLKPFVETKLLHLKAQTDAEAQCMDHIKELVQTTEVTEVSASKTALLRDLAQGLKAMKDEFSNRAFVESSHSRTPTIVADMQSDSSSAHSGRRTSEPRRTSDPRRFSQSTSSRASRLSPNPVGKSAPGTSPQDSFHSGMTSSMLVPEDSIIMEEEASDVEDLTRSTTQERSAADESKETAEKAPAQPKVARHKSSLRRTSSRSKWQRPSVRRRLEKVQSVDDSHLSGVDSADDSTVEFQPASRHNSVVFRKDDGQSFVKTLSFDPRSMQLDKTPAKSSLKHDTSPIGHHRHGAFRTHSRSPSPEPPELSEKVHTPSKSTERAQSYEEVPPEKQRLLKPGVL